MADHSTDRGIPADYDPGDLRRPPRWALVREASIVVERLALAAALPRLRRAAPRGDGRPVMVVPGAGADDRWTRTLRAFLSALDYHVVGWGLRRNTGNVPKQLPLLRERVERLAVERAAPVALVGWSLGGYLAREVARDSPDAVERVVTLGSPIVGGPLYTAAAPMFERRGTDMAAIAAAIAQRERTPIRVPVFVVYSRRDGVVDWRATIDTFDNPSVEHHEIHASHLGLVASVPALRIVAELLARAETGASAAPG